tara:strand:+ start:2237 stop:3247 length:1011 start_codon:yes stop_codon:yes gene_type:complete
MSDNPNGTGEISINDAISLLNTPEEDTVVEERQEAVASEPVEAEADITEEDTQLEAESYEDDEDDAYDAEESDEDDDYEDGEEEPQERLYTVKVDGEEIEVSLDEALQGYQRQQAFTKRSMEIAEQRKAAEQEAAQAKQARDYYAQQLEVLAQQIQQTIPQEPDWVSLAKEVTAEEYNAIRAEYDNRKSNLSKVEQERQAVAQQQAAEQEKMLHEHLRAQRSEMLNRIPRWKDDDVRNKERLEVVEYARNIGFSEEEVAQATDARAVELLYKAMQWDNLQRKKPTAKKRTREAPKMAKAGQPRTKKQVASRSRQQSMNRLNKERSVDAAVSYLMGR